MAIWHAGRDRTLSACQQLVKCRLDSDVVLQATGPPTFPDDHATLSDAVAMLVYEVVLCTKRSTRRPLWLTRNGEEAQSD